MAVDEFFDLLALSQDLCFELDGPSVFGVFTSMLLLKARYIVRA
jgi:hypothetical protein